MSENTDPAPTANAERVYGWEAATIGPDAAPSAENDAGLTRLANWNAWVLDRYRQRLEQGHHDRDCEQRERYGLCDCRKRRRLSDGRTGTPPVLIYQAPMCDGCGEEVYTDAGDSWVCERCHVSWGMSDFDQPGEWDDDAGTHEVSTFENYGERMIVLATGGHDA